VREHLREVADDTYAILNRADPLSDRQRVDARTPARADHVAQPVRVCDGDAFDQEVEVKGTSALELDLHEPLDRWPYVPQRPSKLPEMIRALCSRQMLASGQD